MIKPMTRSRLVRIWGHSAGQGRWVSVRSRSANETLSQKTEEEEGEEGEEEEWEEKEGQEEKEGKEVLWHRKVTSANVQLDCRVNSCAKVKIQRGLFHAKYSCKNQQSQDLLKMKSLATELHLSRAGSSPLFSFRVPSSVENSHYSCLFPGVPF